MFIFLSLPKKHLLSHFPDQITCTQLFPSLLLPNLPILAMILCYFPVVTTGHVLTSQGLERGAPSKRDMHYICSWAWVTQCDLSSVLLPVEVHDLTFPYSQRAFHGAYGPHFHSPCLSHRTFRLLPFPSCCEQRSNGHG